LFAPGQVFLASAKADAPVQGKYDFLEKKFYFLKIEKRLKQAVQQLEMTDRLNKY